LVHYRIGYGRSQITVGIEAIREKLETLARRFLPRNHFARNTIILSLGTTFGQGLAVAASPVLSRLYTPNDFGVLAIYASILGISLNISSFRYEFAIPLAEDNQSALEILVLCLVLVLFTSFLLAIGIIWLNPDQIPFQRGAALKQYIWLLPIGLLLGGSYQIFSYWAVRERMFPALARTTVAQGMGSVVTQLGFGLFKSGPLGLLLGQIAGHSAGLRVLGTHVWKTHKHALRRISLSGLLAVAVRYKKFPLYQSGASLLNVGGLEAPSLLFAGYYGVEVAGWFFLTQKVLSVPLSLIGNSVSQVFLGEAARLLKEPPKLQNLYRQLNKKLFAIGLLPAIILAIGGSSIFKLVFGHEWVQSGTYAQVMAFVFLAKLTTDSVINFAVIERQDLSFIWALIRLVLVLFSILLPAWYGRPGFWAIVSFSSAMIVSYVLKYVMWEFAIMRIPVQGKPVVSQQNGQ